MPEIPESDLVRALFEQVRDPFDPKRSLAIELWNCIMRERELSHMADASPQEPSDGESA